MAFTALITLTTAGSDTGPFDLYSNVDGYAIAFATSVSKFALLAGFVATNVPNGTTTIRVKSISTYCTNYIDLGVATTTTTTTPTTTVPPTTTTTTTVPVTTTTTTTILPTSTLTFSNYSVGSFTFNLSNAIPSANVVITGADVNGSSLTNCTAFEESDNITGSNPLTILATTTLGSVAGNTPLSCDINSVQKVNSIIVNGLTKTNGQTIVIGGTLVTISISTTCVTPYSC